MIRFILPEIFLFFAPFIIYFVWLKLRGLEGRRWDNWGWARTSWFAIAGLGLAAIGFFLFAQFSGAPAGSIYVGPRVENGVVVPGHFVPAPEED